jgi:hypothetical protein
MTYIVPQDLYDEGLNQLLYSPSLVQKKINFVTSYVERITSQFFEPRTKTVLLDGDNSDLIVLPIFCIELTEIKIFDDIQDLSKFTLYNSFVPDDRDYPKVIGYFPKGNRNISFTGSFGYVEFDLSTPEPILFVIKDLVTRLLTEGIRAVTNANITSEVADGHSYSLNGSMLSGSLTGINELDMILQHYTRRSIVTIF